jgi:hypothetical protein
MFTVIVQKDVLLCCSLVPNIRSVINWIVYVDYHVIFIPWFSGQPIWQSSHIFYIFIKSAQQGIKYKNSDSLITIVEWYLYTMLTLNVMYLCFLFNLVNPVSNCVLSCQMLGTLYSLYSVSVHLAASMSHRYRHWWIFVYELIALEIVIASCLNTSHKRRVHLRGSKV